MHSTTTGPTEQATLLSPSTTKTVYGDDETAGLITDDLLSTGLLGTVQLKDYDYGTDSTTTYPSDDQTYLTYGTSTDKASLSISSSSRTSSTTVFSRGGLLDIDSSSNLAG